MSQLEGMDTEGIDVAAVLFPTRGLYALATDDLEPELAANIARAYNDWLADFCAPAPDRLIGCGHGAAASRRGRANLRLRKHHAESMSCPSSGRSRRSAQARSAPRVRVGNR